MGLLGHWAYRLQDAVRRLTSFVYYLPLKLRVGSLAFVPSEVSKAKVFALCERKRLQYPFDPVPYLVLVNLHVSEGNHAKVAELAEDLALLGFFSSTLAKKHAFALCNLDDHRQAIEVLEQAVRLGCSDPWILECLGNRYFTVSEFLLARQIYLQCLELAVTPEVRARVEDLVQQVDVLLGYREGEEF